MFFKEIILGKFINNKESPEAGGSCLDVLSQRRESPLGKMVKKSWMSFSLQLAIIDRGGGGGGGEGMLLQRGKSSKSRIAEVRWLTGLGTLLVYLRVLREVHVIPSPPLLSFWLLWATDLPAC